MEGEEGADQPQGSGGSEGAGAGAGGAVVDQSCYRNSKSIFKHPQFASVLYLFHLIL